MKSRSTGSSSDSAPRGAFPRTVCARSAGGRRFLSPVLAVALALVPGSAIARGGGHGGGGHGGGGHHGFGGHVCGQSVGVRGGGQPAGGSPAWAAAASLPEGGGYPAIAQTLYGEPWRPAYEAPYAQLDPYARVVAARPPRPASPADIYTYADARGVVHFTNYPPIDPGAQVYLRGSTRPGLAAGR
jgi:hypothetical protein